MTGVRSSRTWGARKERTIAELEQLCRDTFAQLKVPPHWKFEEYDRCLSYSDDPDSEIQSIGAWFLDTKTSGLDTKRYRIWFCTYTQKLGLTEISFIDYNKQGFKSINQNKTVEEMSDIINKIKNDDE
jgi:hypothetical protein